MMLRNIVQIFIVILCVTGTGVLMYQLYLTVLEDRSRRRIRREYLEEVRKIRKALEGNHHDDQSSH